MGSMSDELIQLQRLASNALSLGHADIFYRTKKIAGMLFLDDEMDILSEHYVGNNPDILNLIGVRMIDKGHIKSAYNWLTKAATIDREYAEGVRHLLIHYGCMDTSDIWGELSRKEFGYPSMYDPGGLKYPELQRELDGFDLTKKRSALRQGIAPELQDGCPIAFHD